MEYKKKTLANLDIKKDYEEIDTRLASGWYVDQKRRFIKQIKLLSKFLKKLTYKSIISEP